MFVKNFQLMFLLFLMAGTLIAVSANSWFTCWLGLEINLMSMIPLMLVKLNSNFSESSIKYFLTQAMASVLLIFSFSMNFVIQQNLNLEMMEFFIVFALTLKAGMAPAHFWFPQVINNLQWAQCAILFTWQKIAPLILICSLNMKLAIFVSIASAMVGAMGGFNQIFMKMILTYSSISHSGWMIIACLLNFTTWTTYFLIYCSISLAIILFFNSNKLEKTTEVFSCQDSNVSKSILSMNLLSLGGLPPLLGFSAKLNIIITALKFNIMTILIPLILSSLISLFFYSRIIYSNMFFFNNKNISFLNKNKSVLITTTLAITMNIAVPLILLT